MGTSTTWSWCATAPRSSCACTSTGYWPPVRITLPYSGSPAPESIGFYDGTTWNLLPATPGTGNTVYADVTHLSRWGTFRGPAKPTPTATATATSTNTPLPKPTETATAV